MSDVMLFGVLRMPMELDMSDEFARMQFWDRAQEALDRITELERQNAELQSGRSQMETINTFLDAFEAEQLRLLQLDPRERGMQANYSRVMGVMYEVRQFLKQYKSTTAAPHQQSDAEAAQAVKDHLDSLTVYGKDPKQSDEKEG